MTWLRLPMPNPVSLYGSPDGPMPVTAPIRLPAELRERLRAYCAATLAPQAAVIRRALEEYLARVEERPEPLR